MTKFDEKYFAEFNFTREQIAANLRNAEKDLKIATKPSSRARTP
jgi:hypothetical protein